MSQLNSSTTINPANSKNITSYDFLNTAEINIQLNLSTDAAKQWQSFSLDNRCLAYKNLANILRQKKHTFAQLITTEMGKTLVAATAEIEKCASTLEWLANNGPQYLADEQIQTESLDKAYISYLPLGCILGIMPWNFPFWQVIRAAGPIMLSGNGFILKHAPSVMGCAYALQSAFEEAGFPKNSFSVVHLTNEDVAAVIADKRISAVTFTGGPKTGSLIAKLAGESLKKSVLELGGSDAFIVLKDADLDKAVAAAVTARFQNAGQVCIAAKRFIIEEPIYEKFAEKFVSAVKQLKTGDPLDSSTNYGPMARVELREELHKQVTTSIQLGAKLLCGGEVVAGEGFYYQATVLADVRPGMPAYDQETFGPVAALIKAKDADHALAIANNSEYGLSASLWTQNMELAKSLARNFETGGVFINTISSSNVRAPVGGVKKSGYGRELSHFGLREFTNIQTVWISS